MKNKNLVIKETILNLILQSKQLALEAIHEKGEQKETLLDKMTNINLVVIDLLKELDN